ncbi:MAG: hypothetical protein AAF594_06420, partial [Bacteroidota bacterium]
MLRLFLLTAILTPVAGQSATDAHAQAERQMHATLVAQGLSAAEADDVVGCTMREASPTGEPCSEDRIARLLGAPEAESAPEAVAPAPVPEAADAPDTSTASVRMDGVPAFTFEGRAYHTRVSDDFAVLA